ncbi:peptidase inhibitor family I36 protein [Streptomyces sp. NRRL S-1521]|uniref:peptidase inhibitor family I36 protein n=1 Tax=Streptomyces sp. NRRL S-1521 TaxID=1609100 RepID=UPI00131B347F
MNLRKRLVTPAAAVALAGAAVLGTSGPAHAAKADCPRGYLCAWEKPNFQGRMQQVAGDNANLRQYAVFATARSMYNNGAQCSVRVWAGTNFTGDSVVFPRGSQYHDTSGTPMRNGAGSNRWC